MDRQPCAGIWPRVTPLEDNVLSLSITAANAATAEAVNMTATAQPTSQELLAVVLQSLEDDKGEDIVQIDLRGKSEIGDYMVIVSGRSSRQVNAIAEKLSEKMKAEFGIISKTEGKISGDWVLVDTGDIIVHVFRPEVREFYQLEKMWQPGAADDA